MDLWFGIGYMDQTWRPEPGISDITVGTGIPFAFAGLAVTPSLAYTFAPASGAPLASSTVWARLRISATPVR